MLSRDPHAVAVEARGHRPAERYDRLVLIEETVVLILKEVVHRIGVTHSLTLETEWGAMMAFMGRNHDLQVCGLKVEYSLQVFVEPAQPSLVAGGIC